MLQSKRKIEVIAYLLSSIFIFNLFISEISNYKPYSFYLKGASSIVLLLFCLIDYKLNNDKFKNVFEEARNKKTILVFFLIIQIISLFYSKNMMFGALKIIYTIIGVIPNVVAFLYILKTANNERIETFTKSLFFIGLVFGIFSLVFAPYNQTLPYSFELSRWSHVIAGRFLSSIVIIVLLLHFSSCIISQYLLIFTTSFLLISTYFIGLRAAFLGIIILIVALVLFAIIKKKEMALVSISLSLLFSIIAIILISTFNETSTNRYIKLQTNAVGKFEDGAINARLIAYEVSWENIKKYPFLGVGFGGFYNNEISGDIAEIKYPHNLLIEIQLELGVVGSIFFGILLILMFLRAYKFSIPLFIFLLFSFWMAMFSKDIATQTQLWIGIGVLGMNDEL